MPFAQLLGALWRISRIDSVFGGIPPDSIDLAAPAGMTTMHVSEGKHDVLKKPSAHRVGPVKSVVIGILALVVLVGVFPEPMARCYDKVAQQLCDGPMKIGRPRTLGQRARRVLSTTPLIGKITI